MNESSEFAFLRLARKRTMANANAVTEEIADLMPDAFNNTIRWNMGHIYCTLNSLTYGLLEEPSPTPEGYDALFARGTSPADWVDKTPPTLSELRQLLEKQVDEIEQSFSGRLKEKSKKPFPLFESDQPPELGDLLGLGVYHEGLHLGFINGLKRAVGEEQLYQK